MGRMVQIYKDVKKHHSLRIKQEVIFHQFIKSNNESAPELWLRYCRNKTYDNPFKEEFSKINSEVREMEDKIPSWIFIILDLIGSPRKIKSESNRQLLKIAYPDSISTI